LSAEEIGDGDEDGTSQRWPPRRPGPLNGPQRDRRMQCGLFHKDPRRTGPFTQTPAGLNPTSGCAPWKHISDRYESALPPTGGNAPRTCHVQTAPALTCRRDTGTMSAATIRSRLSREARD
jgi:hypothetical protein